MRIGRFEITLARPSRQLVGVAVTLALSLVLSFGVMVRFIGSDPYRLALSFPVPFAFCMIILWKTRREYAKIHKSETGPEKSA